MQKRSLPHRLLRLLVPPVLVAASLAAGAARDYNVELILFKYTRSDGFAAEHWPTTWPVPDTGEALDLDRPPRESFRRLHAEERSIAAIADLLGKSDRYEVLVYEAWRQPGLDKDKAVDILIQAGQKYEKRSPAAPVFDDANEEEDGQTVETLLLRRGDVEPAFAQSASRRPDDGPLTDTYRRISAGSQADPERTVYELEGTVTVVLSRFLHIYADLLYRQPVTLSPVRESEPDDKPVADETTASAPELGVHQNAAPRYRVRAAGDNEAFDTLHGVHIHQHRRMRSEELHHLDHPLLGVIVKVTPAKDD